MFSIYLPADAKVQIGDKIQHGKIQMQILDVKEPMHYVVDAGEKVKCLVKKVA